MKYKVGDKFETEIIKVNNHVPCNHYTLKSGMTIGGDILDGFTKIKSCTDWSQVEMDTPIMVRDEYLNWIPRYFEGVSQNGAKVNY